MSNEKKRVLIVDDSPDDIRILMANLKQDYAVLAATSGEKALEMAIKSPQPDAILMDVSMPGMNGYETCRLLKSNSETQDVDVIFVSAHDTVEEKLSGYDVGGSDYLIKPVQPAELLQKVKQAIENKEKRRESTVEVTEAMKVAMTAITSAGEQGVVLEFMRNSFSVSSIENLAKLIVDSIAHYDLSASVQIRYAGESLNFSNIEPMPPLEKELLSRLNDAGRLIEKGSRFIANYGDISLLIKNMPEDEEYRGRLRDHLALLIEGADARLQVLKIHQQLNELIESSNKALVDFQAQQQAQKEKSVRIMENVMLNLETSFLSYGLTEEQENKLVNVIEKGIEQSMENFNQGLQIDEHMKMILNRLAQFQDQ